jgi:D-cysteine desulfhydrase family pyridoxal phosphate-dependent enzyme
MKAIPQLHFAHLPTPVEELSRLSAALGGPRLLVKRDDATGLAFGGNKTRKLEFLVAAAQADGARTLITAGAAQSNHCRQTAAAAARFGLACVLVLVGDPDLPPTGNLLLDRQFGAEIVWTSRADRDADLQAVFDREWAAGKRPYLVPYGGSSPTGAAGYAFAMRELESLDTPPDCIVFASSSGGTQAGMLVGARLFDYRGRILGISIDERAGDLQARVADLATQTADLLAAAYTFAPEDVEVNDDYLGGGYGVMDAPEVEAIQLFAAHEGLLLDPVYTGRAAAGLIDLIRRGDFHRRETVLFWHTGGGPALFAPQYTARLADASR